MGDPVTAIGAAASITALIDFTTKAIKYAIDFVKAKEDRQELVDKLGTLALILTRLDHREQEARQSKDAWYQGLLAMLEPDGTLTQLKNVLGKMLDELGSSDPDYKLKRLRVRFEWHWDKDEFEGMLKDITRLYGEINLVLGQDHFDLSKKISFQVDNIRDESEVQLELTRLIQQYVVKIRDEGNDTNARVNNIDDRTARLEIHQRMQEKEAEMNRIEAWLSPLTDLARQDKLFEDCFAVGQWFLKEQAFKCWTGGRPWQLRCYGDAGSGKVRCS